MDIFGNLKNALGGAVQGAEGAIGGAIQNFTRPVANFLDQANQQNNRVPIAPQQQAPTPDISGMMHPQGQIPMHMAPQAQGNNVASGLASIPQMNLPNFGMGQAVNKGLGGGFLGNIGQGVADFAPNMVNSVVNAPGDIGRAALQMGQADQNRTPQQGLDPQQVGALANIATPVATLATLGGAGSIVKEIASDGWKQGIVKGLINGMGMGAGFGGLQGLSQNSNAQNIPQQFEKSIPDVISGMVTGGILGSVLAPAGKVFFGNKTPGDAAALSTNGLVPPETMKDAYSLLGVSPQSSLDDIRNGYVQAVQEFHPKNGGTDEAMTALNNAYEMATRNTAPTLSFDQQGNPVPLWNNNFGGNTLSQSQVAQARKGAADNTAFQARVEQLKQGNVPMRATNQPAGIATPQDYLEKGADVLSPQGNEQAVAILKRSAQNQPAFHGMLDSVAQQLGGRALSSIKTIGSTVQKVVTHRNAGEKYNLEDVGDSLRGALVVPEDKVSQAIDAVKQQISTQGGKIAKEQNFFAHPGQTGYEGYHIDTVMPDGQKSEIQIHTPHSWATAQLTHTAYETYDEKLPDSVQKQVSNIRNTISSKTPAEADMLAQQNEQKDTGKVLSPLSSDYSNFQNPEQNLATGQLEQQGLRSEKANATRQVGEQPQTNPNQVRIGQIQNELGQQPNGQSYNEAMGIPNETTQFPIVKNAQGRPTQQPETIPSQVTSPRLEALTRAQGLLKIQPPQTTPEMQGYVRMRNSLQQDLNATQQALTRDPNNGDLRAHGRDLTAKIKTVDANIKDVGARLKVQNTQTVEAQKTQAKEVQAQIQDEKDKLGVQQAVNAEKVRIGNSNLGEVIPEENRKQFVQNLPNGTNERTFFESKMTNAGLTPEQIKSVLNRTSQNATGKYNAQDILDSFTDHNLEIKNRTKQGIGNEKVRIGQPKPGEETANQKAFATGEPLSEVQAEAQKQKAGLPTLPTSDDLVRNKQAPADLNWAPSDSVTGVKALAKYAFQPLWDSLARSKDVVTRQLAYGVKAATDYAHTMINQDKSQLEGLRKKIAPEDIANATRTLEGKETANTPEVQAWVDKAKPILAKWLQRAQTAGVDVHELQNYFPHTYTKDQINAMTTDPEVLQDVISQGKATNLQEASTWLRNNSRELNMNEFGNLHFSRKDMQGKYPYVENPQVVEHYVEQTAHETAMTSVFGQNMAKANQIINSLRAKGNKYDADRAQQLLQVVGATYGNEKGAVEGSFDKALQGIRNLQTYTMLGQTGATPIHHITSLGQIASRVGTGNMLRALPSAGRALLGRYTPEDRENINRLNESNTANLYGQPSGILNKTHFYDIIGLNKALNVMSVVGKTAAQSRMADMVKDIQTSGGKPSAQTVLDLQQAGLPVDDVINHVMQNGKFSNVHSNAYTNHVLQTASLEMSPEHMPAGYNTAIGRMVGQFGGPEYLRTTKTYDWIAKNAKNGNLAPGLALALVGILAGTTANRAAQMLQNKPAGTIGNQLVGGALSGVGPYGSQQVYGALAYPEYNPQVTNNPAINAVAGVAANTVAGPLGGNLLNASQIYGDMAGPNTTAATQKAGLRQLVRNVPLGGVLAGNTFLAPKSYIGNRPSDLLGITNGTNQQPGIQHTAMDLLRANPQVAQQSAQLNAYFSAQNGIIGKLSPADQTTYKGLSALESKAYGSMQDPIALKQYRDTLSNPNMWNTKAQVEKLQAQQDGRQVDPMYKLNSSQAQSYLAYQGMSSVDKAKAAESDTNLIAVDRARNAYYQSPDYAKYQQGLAKNITGYKTHQSLPNPIYTTFPDGKNSYQTAFGTASEDGNQQVADYHYWKSLPSGTPKAQFAANHPFVYDGAIASAPYNQAILQQQWDSRPTGQTPQQFYAAQSKGGFTPNFAGVDPSGKIIQAYNPVGDPIYQASPQLRSAALAYTAFNDAKNTTAKRAVLAQNPQLINLWSARNTYYQNNPQAPNPLDPTQSGIGINFSSSGSSSGGSGGSSGYSSSYSSSGSLRSTMAYMLKYAMHPAPPTPLKLNLKNPFGQSQQATAGLKANPLKQYYGQDQQQLAKLLSSMPKSSIAGAKSGIPTLKLPKIGAKLNFSEKPAVPQSMNERTQAGRVPTGLGPLRQ